MHAFLQHFLCCTEKASSENNNRRSSIASLYILCSGEIDKLISYEYKEVPIMPSYTPFSQQDAMLECSSRSLHHRW